MSPEDLAVLEGEPYRGDLVYLDYRSGREVAIPVTIRVRALDDSRWSLGYEYPEEPQANSVEEVALEEGGTLLGGAKVVAREVTADGVRIVTEKPGEDDGRRATLRYTYTLSRETLTMRKDVRFDGEDELFMRNEFRVKRDQ